MELGDGDELWENRKMEQIAEVHGELQMKFMKIFIFNRKRSKKHLHLFRGFFFCELPGHAAACGDRARKRDQPAGKAGFAGLFFKGDGICGCVK